jgi:catecholate siderophore receptor
MFVRLVSATALSIALAAPADAADDVAAMDDAATAEGRASSDIVVTGQRPEYGVEKTSTATRTNTDVKDIPQAMTVISESQIEDQALRSIADVLTYVPGAMPGTGESNRDQITLRGNSTTADFFVDGIRDDVQYFRDLYNVERVEILRGPNAMIFGRGGGGGIVNRVTKRSSLNAYREFAILGDSEGGFRLTGDVDQPLGDAVGVRVNGMYENGESFRDHVDLERYGVNPTAGLVVGPDTRIDLGYEHLYDRRTADRGIPAERIASSGTKRRPLEGFDDIFFGDPEESYSKSNVDVVTFGLEHQFAEGLTLRNRSLYGDYDKFYQNIYPNSVAAPVVGESEDQVVLAAYNSRNDRRNLFSQTDLIWENQLGGIDQTLLLGFEIGNQKSRNQRDNGTIADPRQPLSNPTVDALVTYGPFTSNRIDADILAFYIQDQIQLSPMFEIVAGLRFDSFKLNVDNLINGQEFERTDELFSPRVGLIVKPVANLSLYASYGRSYLPSGGDQFSSLDITSEALKPERFDNYEVGAKWEPIEGLLATVALYQLDRTNTRAIGPNNTVVLTGEQRSKGLEIGLERSVSDRWQISAGYSWQKAEITEDTSAAPKGREVPLVPRHQFSLWNRYDVTGALGVGLGVVARTKAYASISNAVVLPGYVRLDGALFYEFADGIEAQLNIENLLGEDYFSTAHNDNNIAPGAPTTARAAVRFRF